MKPPRAILPGFPLGHPMGMPFDSDGQRILMKKTLEYVGIIGKPGTLIDLGTGRGEAECEDCKADLAATPGSAELTLK